MPGDGREANTITINLRRDFLGASDQKNLIAEGALRAPSTGSSGAEFTENIDFTLSNSDRHLLHAAMVAQNGESSGFIMPGAQQVADALGIGNENKRKRDEQQTQFRIAEQARRLSEQLARQIAQMEAAFEAEMGDAWREQIANKVMDPDDIPQRREGESMTDYRERLETVLIATMIDPATGEIRPGYTNDSETKRYAEWAQSQHRKNRIDNASDTELESIVTDSQNWEDLQAVGARISSEASTSNFVQSAVEKRDQVAATGNHDADKQTFLSPGS